MPPKRSAPADEKVQEKKKAKRTPKKAVPQEPKHLDDGWVLQYPHKLMYKRGAKLEPSSNIAAFDLDGTLIGQKSLASQPKDKSDWQFFNKQVPQKLKQLVLDEGKTLVIFTNQGYIAGALDGKASDKVRGRIDDMMQHIELEKGEPIPMHVVVATARSLKEEKQPQKDDADRESADPYRKPATSMWQVFIEHCNGGLDPDLKKCFYCGDAAGRKNEAGVMTDFAASDKEFAEGIGLKFLTPEDVFGPGKVKKDAPKASEGSDNHNYALESAMRELAAKKEAMGDKNVFAARAISKVADVVRDWPSAVKDAKELASVKGVGKGTMSLIKEFLDTGALAALQDAEKAVEGGDAPAKAAAVKAKGAEMAMKFI